MLLQQKRLADLQKARTASQKHSSRIRLLRHLSPVLAFFVFVGLFTWPYLKDSLYTPSSEETQIVEEATTENLLKNTLINPKMQGFDSDGRPYQLTAEKVCQQENQKADLEAPQSQLLLKDGTAVKVSSQAGQYDKECNSLDYTQKVHVDTSSGYRLETEAAHVDFKDHQASGNCPLSGQGPAGKFSSEKGFVVKENTLDLLGPSKLVITQK